MAYGVRMTQNMATARIPELTLGWRMQMALQHSGMTAQQIAIKLGVHRGTVTRWMHDEVPVKRGILVAWALTTGVDRDWLITGQGAPSNGGGDGNRVTDEYLRLPGAPVTSILSAGLVHSQPRFGSVPQAA